MSFTNYLENEVLDHILGGADYTRPASVWIALHENGSGDPTDDGANFNEPAAGAYARVEVTNNATEWPAASAGSKANANAVQFPTATAGWGTISHYGIYDAATAGNLLMIGEMTTPQSIVTDDVPIIRAGDIVVNLD